MNTIATRSSSIVDGRRRGVVAVSMVIVLVLISIVIVGLVLSGARDHNLTERRLDTLRAFYAAEAGMHMAVRELMANADHDGDGTIGSISADGNANNDPALGVARFYVTKSFSGGQSTLRSEGRAGSARRTISAVLQ